MDQSPGHFECDHEAFALTANATIVSLVEKGHDGHVAVGDCTGRPLINSVDMGF